MLLNVILADPQVWHVLFGLVGLGLGWYLRHSTAPATGVTGALGALVTKLQAVRAQLDAHGDLTHLLATIGPTVGLPAPAVVPAPTVAPVPPPPPHPASSIPLDLAAALASLLQQRQQQQAHATLAAVVSPAPPAAAPLTPPPAPPAAPPAH